MTLPDGPKTPHWLQLTQWITNPIGYLEVALQRYGDIFTGKIGMSSRPFVVVSNPQALKQILGNDTSEEFTAPGEFNEILAPMLGKYGVTKLSGDRHRSRRKLLMPPFHGERMRSYGQLICELTEKVISQQTMGKPFKAHVAMQEISLQVIIEAVFGLHQGERSEQLRQLVRSLLDVFQSPLTSGLLFFPSWQQNWGRWSPWGYVLHIRRQIDELLYAEIAQRRSEPDSSRNDILSLLLAARDEEGQPMTDLELRDELMTLLFAGHETTATAIAWSLYWVHKQPEVLDKLLAELGSLGKSPEPMSIFQLPYLTAVCNETLRIYPVAILTFARVTKSPVELMGHQLPPDTATFGCIYLTHQREDLYPEPKQFKPERFLEKKFSPYEFLTFGGGSRRCIGEALAMFEMKLVLASILSNYQLALAEQQPEKPQRRGVTLAPAGGVKMIVKCKLAPQRQAKRVVLK
ncbi:cytochrome P450 [Lyngbya aestuarii]|uniref:cytochrome P450 n=1 Tax=Lyngbya aestuarii TaxID=118322 RepID=UPI00403D6060